MSVCRRRNGQNNNNKIYIVHKKSRVPFIIPRLWAPPSDRNTFKWCAPARGLFVESLSSFSSRKIVSASRILIKTLLKRTYKTIKKKSDSLDHTYFVHPWRERGIHIVRVHQNDLKLNVKIIILTTYVGLLVVDRARVAAAASRCETICTWSTRMFLFRSRISNAKFNWSIRGKLELKCKTQLVVSPVLRVRAYRLQQAKWINA